MKDATTDESQIHRWWSWWPDANVGIATGRVSGLVVLDVDCHGEHNGFEGLGRLLEGASLPDTLSVRTGGGGRHFYFTQPDSGIASWKIPHVGELRSDGGYVVAPPSRHASGQAYAFENNAEVADLPTILSTARQRVTPPSSLSVGGRPIPQGYRNDTLARIAGAMRGQGCTPAEIAVALLAVNRARCVPPLPEAEVERVARSIGTRPATRTHFNGGTFWERDILRDLYRHPNELRLFVYLVTEATWREVRDSLSEGEAGVVHTTVRDLSGALAWEENNKLREWGPSTVRRLLISLQARGYIRSAAGEPGTRIEIVNYARFKGFSAETLGGLEQPRTAA